MFYVLFTYSKGNKERDFRGFRSENDLIDFLRLEYERIDIVQIISVEKTYRLGLIETSEIKSPLIQTVEKAAESLKKTLEADLPDLKIPDEAILEPGEKDDRSSKKHPYLKDRKDEPSAMEKIADDIEKEKEEDLTDAEIIAQNKETLEKLRKPPTIEQTLDRGEKAIAAAEKDLAKKPDRLIINPAEKPEKRHYTQNEDRKKDWPTCPECKKNPMAPWNTSGRCSECQQYKKIPKKFKLDKTDWQNCPKCETRKVAPWSKTGICSYCQGNRGKKKKTKDLPF